MVKLTVLYGHPTDPAAFERYYDETHIPLALKMSGVKRVEAGRVAPNPDGSKPPYYRMAELWFESAEQMQQSLQAPEGKATVDDVPNFATGGATIFVSEVATA